MNDISQENYARIHSELEELESFYEENSFGSFWKKVKVIGDLFKNLKPLERSKREELWGRFQGLCEQAKRQREERRVQSEAEKNRILSDLSFMTGTGSPINFNPFDADIIEHSSYVNETIKSARQNLSSIMEDLKRVQNQMTREDQQKCWEAWKSANERLNDLRQELCDRDFQDLDKDVDAVWNDSTYKENPHEVLDEIKRLQARVAGALLSKDQRIELRDHLSKAWDEAMSRVRDRNADRQARHEAWRGKTESWISHQQDVLEKNQQFIERLQGQISELENGISTSTHDDWIERAQVWIQEKMDKIEEVENRNREIEANIEENQEKLDNDNFRH